MKKVGLLVGREVTFPRALIERVNERGGGEVVAEMVTVGGVRHDMELGYDLIIDRISHEVPFYRAFLKRSALEGTIVINNPFWWSADDKFFNYSLAEKLGVAVPRTVLLPQKDYIKGIVSESLRNLEFPLDWEGIAEWVGFPAIIKPFDGGGWKNVSRVNSLEELWQVYDETGTLCMTLQHMVDFDQFVRCYCIGQEEVMIMPYDPRKPYLSGEQYVNDPGYLAPELAERVRNDVRTLCRALGYDINTVEFAIKDGIPYAIDFMNPAPDAELASVGEFYHNWVVNAVADLVFKRLGEPRPETQYRWDSLLNPPAARGEAAGGGARAMASAAAQASGSVIPQPVREVAGNIAEGVSELVSDAAEAVSELVEKVAEPVKRRARAASKKTATGAEAAPKRKSTSASKTDATSGKTATKKRTSTRASKPSTEA